MKLFLMATLGKRAESSWTMRLSSWEQKDTSNSSSLGHDCSSFFKACGLTILVPGSSTQDYEEEREREREIERERERERETDETER